MPVRRSTRLSGVTGPDSEPDNQASVLGTLSQKVYSIPHVRQAILQCLARSDLARFMKVHKGVIGDVAKMLYKELKYDEALPRLKRSTARLRLYCDAVIQIDARDYTFPLAACKALNVSPDTFTETKLDSDNDSETSSVAYRPTYEARQACLEYLRTYRVDVFNLVVPPMRKTFPNLRKILFGEGGPDSYLDFVEVDPESWVVDIMPRDKMATSNKTSLGASKAGPTGHITVYNALKPNLNESPPTSFEVPPAPSDDYTISRSVDLELGYYSNLPSTRDQHDQWLAALPKVLPGIHRQVYFYDLPVTFQIIGSLVADQVRTGSSRLHAIVATAASWNLDDMKDFVKADLSQLTCLCLAKSQDHMTSSYVEDKIKVSFADLGEIVRVVRDNLPKLDRMMISLKGIESAEEDCMSMLSPNSLDHPGKIEYLLVVTAKHKTPMFNIIRCLAPLCSTKWSSSLKIANGDEEDWSGQKQNSCLSYFRAQVELRRKHLAMVDFSSIGVSTPSDLPLIQYTPDGCPKRLSTSRAPEWSSKITTSLASLEEQINDPSLETELKAISNLSREVEVMSASGTSAELLLKSEELFASVTRLRVRAVQVEAKAAEMSANTVSCMETVRQFLGSMKAASGSNGKRREDDDEED